MRLNSLIVVCMVILLMVFGCGRPHYPVRPPQTTPSRTVVLPETKDGKIPKPYEVNGQLYYPLPDAEGFVQYGKASWYGDDFHGRPTSNGETYDMQKMTAAHKTIPFGTYVKVLNLFNNREIVVRVNDRGPFVKGRIIDLSYAAARDIGMIGPGVVEAKVVALGREVGKLKSEDKSVPIVELKDPTRGEFTIQVGAFEDRKNAQMLAARLKVIFKEVQIMSYLDKKGRTLHRVRVSKSDNLQRAGEIEKQLEEMGFKGAFIVRM
ncbi:MAG: septal ring lytic transglycosylase RlpA family protein [Deltaproteobacteria bacterium]|nr:septal ring lytic transglycosylase RlpA family protein [Deltaproteobacteria bacterium]